MHAYRRILAVLLVVVTCFSGCASTGNNSEEGNGQITDTSSQIDSEESQSSQNTEDTSSTENDTLNTENVTQDTETETVIEIETHMYAQTGVNVRKGPGTTYDILGKLTTNDVVTALGEPVDGWQKILYNGETAYVSSKYLGLEKVEEAEPITPPTESYGQVPETTEVPDLTIYEPESNSNGHLIVIDAGHQGKGNSEKEPIGPGATEMKAKVTSGTSGCVSGWDEYELNLVMALKLKEELLSRGYRVAMIREDHNINISNKTRAEAANKLNADAFIRIHANSSSNSSIYGVETICQTVNNPYNGDLYEQCRKLSDCVLDSFTAATGANKRHVWETDTMSGINWCRIPVTIVEMGYMSNAEEDTLMATEEYRNKMVQGMADGIDAYFR